MREVKGAGKASDSGLPGAGGAEPTLEELMALLQMYESNPESAPPELSVSPVVLFLPLVSCDFAFARCEESRAGFLAQTFLDLKPRLSSYSSRATEEELTRTAFSRAGTHAGCERAERAGNSSR